MEKTLVLVKPDGVKNGHIGQVIGRFESRHFEITDMKMVNATREQLQEHYAQLVGKPFYPGIEDFMMSGPIVAMVIAGDDVVESVRKMTGPTNPAEALPGTIRGDFGRSYGPGPIKNIVHSSDSPESANREIKIWF